MAALAQLNRAAPGAVAYTPVPVGLSGSSSEALDHRLTRLEGRVDQLTVAQSQIPAWITPTLTGIGILAAGIAVLVTHNFSVRRQRRDEFFKRIQEAQAVLDRTISAAASIWRLEGSDPRADNSLRMLLSDLTDLTDRLTYLTKLQRKFDVAAVLLEFRSTAMLDIEDQKRPANPSKADAVVAAGRLLSRRLWERYGQVYR